MTIINQAFFAIFVVLTTFSKQTLSFQTGKETIASYNTIEFTSGQSSKKYLPTTLHLFGDSFLIDNKNKANYQWIVVATNTDITQWKIGKAVNPKELPHYKLVDGEVGKRSKKKVIIQRELYGDVIRGFRYFILLKKRKFSSRIRKAAQSVFKDGGWKYVCDMTIGNYIFQAEAILNGLAGPPQHSLHVMREKPFDRENHGHNPLGGVYSGEAQAGYHPELTNGILFLYTNGIMKGEVHYLRLAQVNEIGDRISPLWIIQAEKSITVNGETVPAYTIRNYENRDVYLGESDNTWKPLVRRNPFFKKPVEELAYHRAETFFWIKVKYVQDYRVKYYYKPVSIDFL